METALFSETDLQIDEWTKLEQRFWGGIFYSYDSYNATELGGSCASIVEANIFPVGRILARYAPKTY